MTAQTKTYDIKVSSEILIDYDFVTSWHYVSDNTYRVNVLAEMGDHFERVLSRSRSVVSFTEVVAQVAK